MSRAAALALLAVPAFAEPVAQGPKNVPDFEPAFPEQTRAPEMRSDFALEVATVAEGLVHPWGVAPLPEGGWLVTERPGRMRIVAADGTVSEPLAGIPEVHARQQGGLLDVALSPDFANDRMVYFTYSKPMGDGLSATAAARGTLSADATALEGVADVFVQEPPSPTSLHYGSRLVFDGAGHLFVTTGEHSSAAERGFAQDLGKTYGKVIRVAPDGAVPGDNPFVGTEGAIPTIWSYGHRNIQAAALDADGQLWTVEHGPKGGDELNRIEPGLNYGWPVISYGENYDGSPVGKGITAAEGMEQPRYYWDPVIAPSGLLFYAGDLFADWQGDALVGAMKPAGIMRLRLDGDTVTGEERLLPDHGRIRDLAMDPDGALVAITDDENGALLRITPGPAAE
jgi:glucose/arabinose dehydrogenase